MLAKNSKNKKKKELVNTGGIWYYFLVSLLKSEAVN